MTEFAQVGVRTRARALAMAAAEENTVTGSSRKRKSENGAIMPRIELRSGKNRRGVAITPENSVSVFPAAAAVAGSSRKKKTENDAIVARIQLRSEKNRRGAVITLENSNSMPAAVEEAVTGSFRERKSENDAIVRGFELRSGKNRRGVAITPGNSVSVSAAESGQRCSSLGSSDRGCASCCTSNGSSDRRIQKYADLEDESVGEETSVYYSSRERAEIPDELDSMARTAPEAISRRRSTAEMMPTEAELEEFFTEAEKKIQKQFADKYNYDIAKDKPLQGRYEWIPLKP